MYRLAGKKDRRSVEAGVGMGTERRGEGKEGRWGGEEIREEIERKKKKNWNGESKIKRPKEETRVERWRGKKTQKNQD